MYEFEKVLREEAQLRGLSEVSFKTYFYRLRQFYNYFEKPLSGITLPEIRDYFLYLISVKKVGKESVRNTRYAIRFYYVNCLGLTDYQLEFVKIKVNRKIPVIISREEVRLLLSKVKVPDYRLCLELIYACGLRIGEAVRVKNCDIDGDRKILTIRNGKGAKDRTVPIPGNILIKLREHWKTHKNPNLLFPKRVSQVISLDRSTTIDNIARRTVENAMKLALKDSGINKRATPHTLRHCYATHLLEAGAHIKAISQFLGHRSLRPTMIYLHLTNNSEIHSYNVINEIMSDL
jgi:site-specific recombinase XerD